MIIKKSMRRINVSNIKEKINQLKNNKKLTICILLAVIAILALVICSWVPYMNCDKVACKYATALMSGNYKDICKYNDFEIEDYLYRNIIEEAVYGESQKDTVSESLDSLRENYNIDIKSESDMSPSKVSGMFDYLQDMIKEEYGEYSVTTKVTESKKLSGDEFKSEYAKAMRELGSGYVAPDDVRLKNLSQFRAVKVEITLEGEKDTFIREYELVMLRSFGKWRTIDASVAGLV